MYVECGFHRGWSLLLDKRSSDYTPTAKTPIVADRLEVRQTMLVRPGDGPGP